jgi:hypothetical protein
MSYHTLDMGSVDQMGRLEEAVLGEDICGRKDGDRGPGGSHCI